MHPVLRHPIRATFTILPPLLYLLASGASAGTGDAIQVHHAGGTELHYVDTGSGEAAIFVHGGLADYRELAPLAAALPGRYRTVVYSRRHSFPNENGGPGAAGHMALEVADLAGLIETLELAPAHVIGTSYGGFVALMLAKERPDLVRSITAAEPPLLHWLPGIDGGQDVYDDFEAGVLAPSRTAFAAGMPEEALRIAMDYFVGPGGLDLLPREVREMLRGNVRDWEAITSAPDALPEVSREEIAAIEVPVLLLSGAASAAMHNLIDTELLLTLADGQQIIIEDGTHEMCVEQLPACAKAIEAFIGAR